MTTRNKCDECGSTKLERMYYVWRRCDQDGPESFDLDGAEPSDMGFGDWFCPDCDAAGRDAHNVCGVEYETDVTVTGTPVSYTALHDGLSDMIESGRLTESDIPDDYRWLVESLTNLSN